MDRDPAEALNYPLPPRVPDHITSRAVNKIISTRGMNNRDWAAPLRRSLQSVAAASRAGKARYHHPYTPRLTKVIRKYLRHGLIAARLLYGFRKNALGASRGSKRLYPSWGWTLGIAD